MSLAGVRFIPNDMRTTLITITSYENKVPVGTLFNSCYEGEIAFCGMIEFLLTVDKMLDVLDLPRAAVSTRSFTSGEDRTAVNRVRKLPDAIATFKLKVLFRQNASWQGSLTWTQGGSEAAFRSVFELIHLMDNALTNAAGAGELTALPSRAQFSALIRGQSLSIR